jgi:hypothetical protein
MRIAMLLLCLGTAACARGEEARNDAAANTAVAAPAAAGSAANSTQAAAPTPPAQQPVVRVTATGLEVAGQRGAQTIAFGTPADETLRILTEAIGAPTGRGTNSECGAGALDFADFRGGLDLLMQDGRFAGWGVTDGTQFRTTAGIGIGSTRRELDAAYRTEVSESTLGHEFTAGEIGGLLNSAAPTGRVDALWAGVTCHFR